MQRLVDSSSDFSTRRQYFRHQYSKIQLIPDRAHASLVSHSRAFADFVDYLPSPAWIAHWQCHLLSWNCFTMYVFNDF